MQVQTESFKLNRVMREKHIKEPGDYVIILQTVPKDEKFRTVRKDSCKTIAYVGGMCPKCKQAMYGQLDDIDDASAVLTCPNDECKLQFKIGDNKASIQLLNN